MKKRFLLPLLLSALLSYFAPAPAQATAWFDGTTYLMAQSGAAPGLQMPSSTTSQKGMVLYFYNSLVPPPINVGQIIQSAADVLTGNTRMLVEHVNVGGSTYYAQLTLEAANGTYLQAQNLAQPLPYDGNWHAVAIAWDLSVPKVQMALDAVQSNHVQLAGSGVGSPFGINYANTLWGIGGLPSAPGGEGPVGQLSWRYTGALAKVYTLLYDGPYVDLFSTLTKGGTYAATWVQNNHPCMGPMPIGMKGENLAGVTPTIWLSSYSAHFMSLLSFWQQSAMTQGFGWNNGFPFTAYRGRAEKIISSGLPEYPTMPVGCGPHP